MRQIYIQHPQTRMFLREMDDWTPHSDKARDFKTSLNAVAFCLQHQMPDAQIVVRFDQPGMEDVVVPVQISRKARAADLMTW
jgi:hypothetical protein